MNRYSNAKNIIFTSTVLLLWASSYVAIRHALEQTTPENLAFLRYFIASIGFIIAGFFTKTEKPRIADIAGFIFLGLTGFALYNLCLNWGERTVTAGIASFIINTVPFFTMIIVFVKKEEKLWAKDWIAMLTAFSGVALIIFTQNGATRIDYNSLLILVAAVCQAIYFSLQKTFLTRYSPITLTRYAVWSGTVFLFFFSDNSFQSLSSANTSTILVVFYLGLFPGMLAYLIMAFILGKQKVTNVSSYLFLIPFITLLLGWFFKNELPTVWAFVGGALVVFGIVLKNWNVE